MQGHLVATAADGHFLDQWCGSRPRSRRGSSFVGDDPPRSSGPGCTRQPYRGLPRTLSPRSAAMPTRLPNPRHSACAGRDPPPRRGRRRARHRLLSRRPGTGLRRHRGRAGVGGVPDAVPDWRSAQARGVEAMCRSSEHEVWVAVEADRAVGFVAVRYVEEDAARRRDRRCGGRPAVSASGRRSRARAVRARGDPVVGGRPCGARHGRGRGARTGPCLYESLGFHPYRHVRYYKAL